MKNDINYSYKLLAVNNIWGIATEMPRKGSVITLTLLGPFRLEGPKGERIEIRSKRGQALLAMLATSGGGERTRGWLQERLWFSRSPEQANASLRRELSNLRKVLNSNGIELLSSDNGRVWINLEQTEIDVRQIELDTKDEFLEAIDIPGEELFEDWLREERSAILERQSSHSMLVSTPIASEHNVQVDPDSFTQRPAIAVLPFSSPGQEENLAQIALGISEDLIDRLSRLRWLPVIARSSSFALKDEQLDVQSTGRALDAQYIVEGTLRQEEEQRVLKAMLSDTRTGQSLWSNRMILPQEVQFETLEILLSEITATLGMQVDLQEQVRAQRKPQSDLNVNELIWRGRAHLNKLTLEDAENARQCFEQALEKEPNSPEALVQIAWVQIWSLWLERGTDEDIRLARRSAQKAIIADHDDARGHMLAGIAEIWLKQPLRAESLLSRAIELNPSLAMAHAQLGSALHLKGAHREAITALHRAVRLSPNDHDLFYTFGELAMAHLFLNEYDEALGYAEQSLARRTSYWIAHIAKIKVLTILDRKKDAQAARREFQELQPHFRSEFIDWLPFMESSKNKFLKEELNLLPGQNDQ